MVARRALLAIAAAALLMGASARALEGTVTRVVDGDTLWVRVAPNARPIKVRVQGIDAPEICQPWGREAKRALAQLVLSKAVAVDDRAVDAYGRVIGRLTRGGVDVGQRMVLQGYAWSSRFHDSGGPYDREEREARALRRGLFSQSAPESPDDFRRRHGRCF